jgi:type I restriction-modification system DNA methylase subunit
VASPENTNGDKLGLEAPLWDAAGMLRNGMGSAEYKHVVFGFISLQYAFEERHKQLQRATT